MAKSRRQTFSPAKLQLLDVIMAQPGLHTSELTQISGLPHWAVLRLLKQMLGHQLITCQVHVAGQNRRTARWYPGSSNVS